MTQKYKQKWHMYVNAPSMEHFIIRTQMIKIEFDYSERADSNIERKQKEW